MLIGNNWKIESENLNVTLYQKKRRRNKITGESYLDWKTIGYFATVENALHELVNQGVRDTELKELKTIVERINNLHQLIKQALQPSTAIIKGVKVKA